MDGISTWNELRTQDATLTVQHGQGFRIAQEGWVVGLQALQLFARVHTQKSILLWLSHQLADAIKCNPGGGPTAHYGFIVTEVQVPNRLPTYIIWEQPCRFYFIFVGWFWSIDIFGERNTSRWVAQGRSYSWVPSWRARSISLLLRHSCPQQETNQSTISLKNIFIWYSKWWVEHQEALFEDTHHSQWTIL